VIRELRIALAAIAAIAAGGCGLGPGPGTSSVSVTVTRGFGAQQVAQISKRHVPGSETVLRILERSFHVTTRYGGGFVESINGLSGSSARLDWFYYVNGVQAGVGAASTAIHHGDRIWWDLHDWSSAESIPAVVGSFPEPFVHGVGGKRLPTTVACAQDVGAACNRVTSRLTAAGVPVSPQFLGGTGSGTDSLGVVVGTWSDLRATLAASLVDHGPGASGVYARFAGPSGRSLELLDPRGRVVRTLTAGAGLIAATSDNSSQPTWMITGTDPAGVSAAAAALTGARLHDHFALAIQGATDLPVPLQGTR
jgi:Domain of unknown function (DUF4430)